MVLGIISPLLYLREDTESGQDNRASLPKCYSLKNVLSASLPAMVVAIIGRLRNPEGTRPGLLEEGPGSTQWKVREDLLLPYGISASWLVVMETSLVSHPSFSDLSSSILPAL